MLDKMKLSFSRSLLCLGLSLKIPLGVLRKGEGAVPILPQPRTMRGAAVSTCSVVSALSHEGTPQAHEGSSDKEKKGKQIIDCEFMMSIKAK